jgi:hypothetical protein
MGTTLTVAEVETAIKQVLQFQRVRLLDEEYTFADLERLRDLRDEVAAIKNAENGCFFTPVRFLGPR